MPVSTQVGVNDWQGDAATRHLHCAKRMCQGLSGETAVNRANFPPLSAAVLSFLLAVALLPIVPAAMLWRSLLERRYGGPSRLRRYVRSMALAAALITVLAIDWIGNARPVSALGFDHPLSAAGLAGLVIAALVLVAVFLSVRARGTSGKDDELLPTTQGERAVFIAFVVTVGIAWEMLYRGFLLWILPPSFGPGASVAMAAAAYALAHGYRSIRLLGASLASALAFTVAYAVTRSLWWLILLHCGLPLMLASARIPKAESPSKQRAL